MRALWYTLMMGMGVTPSNKEMTLVKLSPPDEVVTASIISPKSSEKIIDETIQNNFREVRFYVYHADSHTPLHGADTWIEPSGSKPPTLEEILGDMGEKIRRQDIRRFERDVELGKMYDYGKNRDQKWYYSVEEDIGYARRVLKTVETDNHGGSWSPRFYNELELSYQTMDLLDRINVSNPFKEQDEEPIDYVGELTTFSVPAFRVYLNPNFRYEVMCRKEGFYYVQEEIRGDISEVSIELIPTYSRVIVEQSRGPQRSRITTNSD